MQIIKAAMAGTLESSDAQVTLEPADHDTVIDIHSSVQFQYGRQIRQTVEETLKDLGVSRVKVRVVDKGALSCTLKARVECAAFRAAEQQDGFPWGGVIK